MLLTARVLIVNTAKATTTLLRMVPVSGDFASTVSGLQRQVARLGLRTENTNTYSVE